MGTHPSPSLLRTAAYCRVGVVFLDSGGRVERIAPGSPLPHNLAIAEGKPPPPELRSMSPGDWKFLGEGWFAQAEGREETEALLLRRVRTADAILGPYGDSPINEEMVRILLDNPYEGLTVVDREGRITLLSPSNEKWFGLEPGGAIGLLLADLSPKSRLPQVAKTGTPERAQVLDLHGKTKVTLNLPVKKGGKVIGGLGRILFQNPEQVEELSGRIRDMELKVERYETLLDELRGRRWTFGDIIAEDPAMKGVLSQARRIADSSANVLILGESGTGKELVAQALHEASGKKRGPFIAVNCAAIPHELIESELFGYEEGAFSGAKRKGKPGKFELATGGTLFLDEICELPLGSQAKLLRAIEERKIERLGATATREVDFRLIAATNRDPAEMVSKGEFRGDLYYRLHEIPVELPPLRARKGDIPLLAARFLAEIAQREKLPVRALSPEALEALRRYDWPGNVRELRSVIRRSAWQAKSATVEAENLPALAGRGKTAPTPALESLSASMARAEKSAIEAALAACGNNRAKSAKLLGIHRTALYKKMEKLGIGKVY